MPRSSAPVRKPVNKVSRVSATPSSSRSARNTMAGAQAVCHGDCGRPLSGRHRPGGVGRFRDLRPGKTCCGQHGGHQCRGYQYGSSGCRRTHRNRLVRGPTDEHPFILALKEKISIMIERDEGRPVFLAGAFGHEEGRAIISGLWQATVAEAVVRGNGLPEARQSEGGGYVEMTREEKNAVPGHDR